MTAPKRLAIVRGTLKLTSAKPSSATVEVVWTSHAPLHGVKITAEALAELLRVHSLYLSGSAGGRRANLNRANLNRANLDGANLDGANLNRANLYGASLDGANLDGANLYGASLNRANLDGANLNRANLYGANLNRANLDGANLDGANLYGANLNRANLYGANLYGANLYGANLYGANLNRANLDGANLDGANLPSPTVVLLALWGALSPGITAAMMRYDAACHPDPTAFDRWAAGGGCPYIGVRVQRAAHFHESRDLWSPGPCPRPHDLMVAVLAEKCPAWTDEQRVAFQARFAPVAP